MYDWRESGVAIAVVTFFVACFVWSVYSFYETQLKTGEVTITVESKERIADGDSDKWVVFSTDGETYQVTDNILFGLTSSTDRYRELQEGVTYECSTIGSRWPIFSLYKNLNDCQPVGG